MQILKKCPKFFTPNHYFSVLFYSLADQKKEEGNQLYLSKNYREALERYNEAISKCKIWPKYQTVLLHKFFPSDIKNTHTVFNQVNIILWNNVAVESDCYQSIKIRLGILSALCVPLI